jgi:hypothetical protein
VPLVLTQLNSYFQIFFKWLTRAGKSWATQFLKSGPAQVVVQVEVREKKIKEKGRKRAPGGPGLHGQRGHAAHAGARSGGSETGRRPPRHTHACGSLEETEAARNLTGGHDGCWRWLGGVVACRGSPGEGSAVTSSSADAPPGGDPFAGALGQW